MNLMAFLLSLIWKILKSYFYNMEKIKKVLVSLDFGFKQIQVGTLIEDKNRIYFQFDSSFLDQNLNISPFKLKKSNDVYTGPPQPFDGLFGVFNDSLPDGWGRLLMDRKWLKQGKNILEIGVLERLAYVGSNAQGALVYKPDLMYKGKDFELNLDSFAFDSLEILKNNQHNLLDELYQLGGNSVGARPKVLIPSNANEISVLPKEGYEPWIIKFSSLHDIQDNAKVEYAYYQMATNCGIKMSESKLFRGESGNVYFGTKRFDRINTSNRLHYHSASGLLHDNFRMSSLDYGHVMDALNRLENNFQACERVFRIACFNVFTCNMDDHSKNIAFLMDDKGNWSLSPAFDLTFSPVKGSYQSMSIAGNHQEVSKKDLLNLANQFNINHATAIIEEIENTVVEWKKYAQNLEINSDVKNLIDKSIKAAIRRK